MSKVQVTNPDGVKAVDQVTCTGSDGTIHHGVVVSGALGILGVVWEKDMKNLALVAPALYAQAKSRARRSEVTIGSNQTG
jgi:hypothetical protein